MHKFPYRWTLKDARFTKDKGKVFSCFACGGGSTMGYKLAGFDVIGCNEIDPRMNKVYVANHHPKFNYLCDIRQLVEKAKAHELPEELYNLDILDGSPPCSTFSISGSREDAWGKEKKFREGQVAQVLDTLFFDFIDLANELRPKVVIGENVKGILIGNAIDYVRRIIEEFDKAGYTCQTFLLDAQYMGVPQRRERAFFICMRKDIAEPFMEQIDFFTRLPKLTMEFNEEPIPFKEIEDAKGRKINPGTKTYTLWQNIEDGDTSLADAHRRLFGKEAFFNSMLFDPEKVAPTIVADTHSCQILKSHPCYVSRGEHLQCSTFPMDYQAESDKEIGYMVGMSVPPVMMAQVASNVYDQWLSKM